MPLIASGCYKWELADLVLLLVDCWNTHNALWPLRYELVSLADGFWSCHGVLFLEEDEIPGKSGREEQKA